VISLPCVRGGSRSRAIRFDHEFSVGGARGGQFLVSFVETAAQLDVLLDEVVVAAVQSFDVRRCAESGRVPGLFDDIATRNLVEAAKLAGSVNHFVYISVIGADCVPIGYLARKLAAEKLLAESGIAWTTLRAAQFHDLALKTVQGMAKMPVLLAPGGVRWQPVDSRDVARRLAQLTLEAPAGLVGDLAGPKVYTLEELQRTYLNATGKRRLRLPIRVPGKAGKVYRSGQNLSLDADTGTHTWEEFLAERVQ
jgi:uncharacterized protein YbjT (DUF2867 family)